MMQNKVIVFLMFVTALLWGCHDSQVKQQLDLAEDVMEEHPDSALDILQQIDGSSLRGEPQACHALLLSQAYDKNYIDRTSDSLISIATTYYDKHNDKHRKLMAGYYHVVILMNRLDYDEALSLAFDVEKLADKLHDIEYLARIRLLIARAYLFSFNQEGAKDYFEKSLDLMRQLQKREWTGMVFINLSNLALIQKNYARAIAFVDSAKTYVPDDPDIHEYEMLAQIGLNNYEKADSIFNHHISHPSTQAKTYELLVAYHVGKTHNIDDSLNSLLSNATHFDSIYIASVGSQISRLSRNDHGEWKYTDILFQELNNVIDQISAHSLYRIQLEHDKNEHAEAERSLHNKYIISLFVGIIALLIITFGIIYFRMLRKRHEEQIARTKDEVLLVSSEFAEMQAELMREIDHRNNEVLTLNQKIQAEQMSVREMQSVLNQERESHHQTVIALNQERGNHQQTVLTLNQQINRGQTAAQELFISKYAWIEELGNIFIDAETSKASNRAMKDLKKRLDTVKTRKFIEHLIEVINKYCNNLIKRVENECPAITESELTILALLCANLSTRIISFILNITPRRVYNAKYSIKRKLEKDSPEILHELHTILA